MSVKKENRADIIRRHIKNLPYFSFKNLLSIEKDREYLRILMSRMSKNAEIIRLKRGLYVHKDYLNDVKIKGESNEYFEFMACLLYEPSYLSMEYVLSEYGLLAESTYNYTLVSTKKTNKLKNNFGFFVYRNAREQIFTGYKILKKGNYIIKKASLAKALFDFLYFRKKVLTNRDSFNALRLNLNILKKKDILEFKKYVQIDNSKKMLEIFNWLA